MREIAIVTIGRRDTVEPDRPMYARIELYRHFDLI